VEPERAEKFPCRAPGMLAYAATGSAAGAGVASAWAAGRAGLVTPAMKRSAIKIHSEHSAAPFSAPVNEVGPVAQSCPDRNALSGKPFAARIQLAMPESPKDFIKRHAPRTEAKANTPRESPKDFFRRLRLRLVVPAEQQQQAPGGVPEH